MKEEINITEFGCDNCGRKTNSATGFPYDEGWFYLYKLAFKTHQTILPNYGDKHFCSADCMKKWVMKTMNKELGVTEEIFNEKDYVILREKNEKIKAKE